MTAKKAKIELTRLEAVCTTMKPWNAEQPQNQRDYWALMNHLSEWITEEYGHRCPETNGGCVTCQAWAVYDLARAIFMSPE